MKTIFTFCLVLEEASGEKEQIQCRQCRYSRYPSVSEGSSTHLGFALSWQVFLMPTFGPGALLIGDIDSMPIPNCFPASAGSDLPLNKFSPHRWEEGSSSAVFSVGFC